MRNLCQKFLIVSGILLSIFIFDGIANACSCRPMETVDKAFAKTPNVVALKLKSVKQADGEATNYFLSVEKVFKGELKIGEILTFKPGSNCDWFFSEVEIETEFLFYLGNKPTGDEAWVASTCSRSGRIKNKTADLSYLENEKKLRGKTRLSGMFEKRIETVEDFLRLSLIPLADRKVRITGKGRSIELVTDENGVYEIYDLPAGKYKITPEKLNGFVFLGENTKYAEVEIKAKNHTEQNFYYFIDNEISGKVIDSNGKPIEDVCVDLISLPTKKVLGSFHQSCTDKNGEFEIKAIPVGTYKIAVNKDDEWGFHSPNRFFNTFFYPNAKTEEEAAEISVEANYFLKNLLLVPPEMAETVTLTGRLIFADGKPAADQTIQFLKGEEISKSSGEIVISNFEVKTDKNGQFSIKILKGQPGILRGIIYSFLGEYKNCPEIDEILKQKGDRIQQLETERLEITAAENIAGIELKLPFPSCKEIK